GYVYRIEEGLEAHTGKNVKLQNLGIPGAEIDEIDNIEIQLLKLTSPDLVTISVGGNDIISGTSPESFESALNGLFNKIRSIAPHATVAIANLPDLLEVERFIK